MKKIFLSLFLIGLVCSLFAQEPAHVKKPKTFQPGNWYMIGNWDTTAAAYKDTIGFYLEGDTNIIWSNKMLLTNSGGGLSVNGLINTDSSYYLRGIEFIKANHSLANQYIGIYSGINNTTGNSNTSSGASTLVYNTTGINNSAFGTSSLYANITGNYNTAVGRSSITNNKTGSGNTAIGYRALYSDTAGSNNIAIGYLAGNSAQMSNRLWIGSGDSNAAIIYGEMLTRPRIRINGELFATNLLVNQSATIGTNLTVHGDITNGGLINKDTVLILADDATFNFPTSSVGWAEIQCDSVLIEKTWGVVSWNCDGSTSLRSNGAKFVNTDIDGNYACFYDGGVYAILKNTSGYTQTYSIKYHYHN